MKILMIAAFSFLLAIAPSLSRAKAGFYLPDSLDQVMIPYVTFHNLMVVPVKINDSGRTHKLIVDTGCRNLVLFGRNQSKMFNSLPSRTVEFSGLGSGRPVHGDLYLDNTIIVDKIKGEHIPIVVVPYKNVFGGSNEIDGVIGYDLFIRFEVEINPATQMITFRNADQSMLPSDFSRVTLNVSDTKPAIESSIDTNNKHAQFPIIIDTGSSLGLLLKLTTNDVFEGGMKSYALGQGFSGTLEGFDVAIKHLKLSEVSIHQINAQVTSSDVGNSGSIGMNMLKDYHIIINYCKSYLGLKRLDQRFDVAQL